MVIPGQISRQRASSSSSSSSFGWCACWLAALCYPLARHNLIALS